MIPFEKMTSNEQVWLLGLVPLLGATTHVGVALAAVLIGVLASAAVRWTSRLLPAHIEPATTWTLYAVVGLLLASVITDLAGLWIPIPDSAVLYLTLTGVTPLVFTGVAKVTPAPVFRNRLGRFIGWMILLALLRETLGRGTIWNLPLWSEGRIPVGILAGSVGAFLGLGGLALGESLLKFHRARNPGGTT